ncbi:MAG TPA: hypothetical protein VK698_37455 [Kofleriaceae bacterium]|nr:hypothetical protein [Kofleriaceae bacterium]
MKRRAPLVIGALAGAVAFHAAAGAEPGRARPIDLSLRRMPMVVPSSLVMRRPAVRRAATRLPTARRGRRVAQVPAGAARPGGGAFEPIAPLPAVVRQDAAGELAAPERRLDEKLIFRFNLGFGIDGGQPSNTKLLSGSVLDDQLDYAKLRSYSFGDLVLGTRGVLFPTLSSYFAGEFRFDQGVDQPTQAVPSVSYGESTESVLIRSAYAESQGFLHRSWLRPIYLRAGRQFKYGVTVAHFDGLTLGYDTRAVSGSIWFGSRVSLYGFGQNPTGPQDEFFGASTRIDLYELSRVPLVLTADSLRYAEFDHQEFGVGFRWKPDIMIRGSVRQLNSDIARQTLAVWARLSEVTTVTAEIDNRTADDWIYDLIVLRPPQERGDPRNYLNLGPPLPRVQLDVRAGTVILRNLDVLLRGAAAVEHAPDGEDSAFAPSYLEAGAAVEVRLRRDLRLGSSFLARRYRLDAEEVVVDTLDQPDPLPALGAQVGERSFYEGGLGVDYSVGARRFNASGELYGRLYYRQTDYQPLEEVEPPDLRTGGRFSVEGWASNRLRIKAEYDISISDIDLAPELRGIKTLRVLAEGSY